MSRHSIRSKRALVWFIGVLLAIVAIPASPVQAAVAHVVVRPGSLHGWHATDTSGHSNGRWVTGPSSAPLGRGSAHLSAASNDLLEFDPASPRDLSSLVATYETYGGSPAALILSLSGGAMLITYPSTFSAGWQSFDAMSSASWLWDCESDGSFEGSGSVLDFLSGGCPDSQVVAMIFAPLSGDAYVDAVELGTSGATTVSDMEPGTIAVADVRKVEHDAGAATMTFRVRLSGPNREPVQIRFSTVNGTARAGSDYRAKRGTLRIPAGSTSALIKIRIIGDRHAEANERFKLRLSAPIDAKFGDSLAVGTIVDDD